MGISLIPLMFLLLKHVLKKDYIFYFEINPFTLLSFAFVFFSI